MGMLVPSWSQQSEPAMAPIQAIRPLPFMAADLTLVHQALTLASYEARQVRGEIVAAHLSPATARPYIERALHQGERVFASVASALEDVSPEQQVELCQLGEALIAEIAILVREHGDPALEQRLQQMAQAAASATRLPLAIGVGRARDVSAEDAEALAAAELVAVEAELLAAKGDLSQRWDPRWEQSQDLPGDVELHRLRAVQALLQRINPDDRKRLEPKVSALAAAARAVRQFAPNGARMREVLIRVSELMNGVDLADRLDPDTMVAKIARETTVDHARAGHDAAEFEAEAGTLGVLMASEFDVRNDGVQMVQGETHEKDPAKPKNFWDELLLDLAFAALSAATGGLAGLVVNKAMNFITGGRLARDRTKVAAAEEAIAYEEEGAAAMEAGAAQPTFLMQLTEMLADKAKAATKAALDAQRHKMGSADGPAAGGGGELSSYADHNFFAAQHLALRELAQASSLAAIDSVKTLRAGLGEAPEAMILPLRALNEARREVSLGRAMDTQANETRARFVALHARAAVAAPVQAESRWYEQIGFGSVQRAEADEDKEDFGRVMELAPARTEFEESYDSLISMEAKAGEKTTDPVRLTSAWVKGVNQGIRAKLRSVNLIEANMPMRLRVRVGEPSMYGDPNDLTAVMARDEQGQVWAGGGEGALGWLAGRAGASSPDDQAALESAARHILEKEIGWRTLAQQGVTLDGG